MELHWICASRIVFICESWGITWATYSYQTPGRYFIAKLHNFQAIDLLWHTAYPMLSAGTWHDLWIDRASHNMKPSLNCWFCEVVFWQQLPLPTGGDVCLLFTYAACSLSICVSCQLTACCRLLFAEDLLCWVYETIVDGKGTNGKLPHSYSRNTREKVNRQLKTISTSYPWGVPFLKTYSPWIVTEWRWHVAPEDRHRGMMQYSRCLPLVASFSSTVCTNTVPNLALQQEARRVSSLK